MAYLIDRSIGSGTDVVGDKVLDALVNARALIADGTKWRPHAAASEEGGYCSYGALIAVRESEDRSTDGAIRALTSAAGALYGRGPVQVNDTLGHAATLRMFDRAIAARRSRQQEAR